MYTNKVYDQYLFIQECEYFFFFRILRVFNLAYIEFNYTINSIDFGIKRGELKFATVN